MMQNDQIPSDIKNKSESTSVLSVSDPLFLQKPALSVWKDLVWKGSGD